MIDHKTVYKNEANRYQQLISFEDFDKNINTQLNNFIGFSKPSVLESGCGTGRLTRILQPLTSQLVSFDINYSMLHKARTLSQPGSGNLAGFSVADHRLLPVNGKQFDIVVSGWSVCYLATWQGKNWKCEVNHALQEFARTVNSDGTILIIESLGTGNLIPDPPAHLKDYLHFLESLQFTKDWVRTDYKFPDRATAESLTDFFFGKEMLQNLSNGDQPVLPECTGFWKINRSDLQNSLKNEINFDDRIITRTDKFPQINN